MINMQKINNKITGLCPEWVLTGNKVTGGFCASFQYGKNIIINNGYFFENNIIRRNLVDNIIDNTYHNVSVTMNIDTNNLNYDMVINEIQNNLYGNFYIKDTKEKISIEKNLIKGIIFNKFKDLLVINNEIDFIFDLKNKEVVIEKSST
jgi:hypothetical protein